MFRELTEERKYFPIVCAICLFLLTSASGQIIFRPLIAYFGWLSSSSVSFSWINFVKDYALFVCVFPSLAKFVSFLWEMNHASGFTLLCVGPLNLVPPLASHLLSLQILAVIGIVGVLFQYYMSTQIQKHGLEVI